MYEIGNILFWPFSNYLIGEAIWLVCVIVSIAFSKKQRQLKRFLLWWLAPAPIFIFLFRTFNRCEAGFMGLEGQGICSPFFVFALAVLWFLYLPIVASIYFGVKA